MTRNLIAALSAVTLAVGGPAVANAAQQQQPQQPAAQMPQMMGTPTTGQMAPMPMHPMMNDPAMRAQMMEMMQGCHRMMSQMQAMPSADGRR